MHGLKQTESRVVALDRQIASRLFQKEKADLNELHMAQTLEEAMYLEATMVSLSKVQEVKENAARELFELHITNLKEERDNNERRSEELELFAASATLEMAKLVAHYSDEDNEDQEDEARRQQQVDAMERTKTFSDNKSIANATIGLLYDTVVWKAATNNLRLTSSSGSSLCSSDFGSYYEDVTIDLDEDEERNVSSDKDTDANIDSMDCDDGTQTPNCSTPTGKMHARMLAKELKLREKIILKRQKKERKKEHRVHQMKSRALKVKHLALIEKIVEDSLNEREELREDINDRMETLRKRQEESSETMKRRDERLMRDALFAEDQRIQEAESACFMKAQELVSAQVFHEGMAALNLSFC